MRFNTRMNPAIYVVEPSYKVQIAPGQERVHRGLRARFASPGLDSGDGARRVPGFFDSEAAARQNGWTEEQRLQVERALLLHPDFGFGLYLAQGETIGAEHDEIREEVMARLAYRGVTPDRAGVEAEVHVEERCAHFKLLEDGTTQQCGRKPAKDSDLCAQHKRMAEESVGAVA